MPLVVEVTRQDHTCFISPVGVIDSLTSKIFDEKIQKHVDESVHVLVLNMEGVDYISSMGLSMIVKAKKRIEGVKGVFMMTNLQPQIQKVLKVVKALPGLNIFKNMEEADAYLDRIQKEVLKNKKLS
ncbi:MAG: STAS domain-containing protein [Candidatus Omnitrophota bacterium]